MHIGLCEILGLYIIPVDEANGVVSGRAPGMHRWPFRALGFLEDDRWPVVHGRLQPPRGSPTLVLAPRLTALSLPVHRVSVQFQGATEGRLSAM